MAGFSLEAPVPHSPKINLVAAKMKKILCKKFPVPKMQHKLVESIRLLSGIATSKYERYRQGNQC